MVGALALMPTAGAGQEPPEVPDGAPPAAPALTGVPASPTRDAIPVLSWTGPEGARYEWSFADAAGAGPAGHGPETAVAPPAPLADGPHTFTVRRLGPLGEPGEPATHAFTVDTVPPPPPRITARPSFPTTLAAPTFGVADIEPGAAATWQVAAAGGALAQGPGPVQGPTITLAALPPGSYVFQVRQSDAAGNVGAPASAPFAIVPPPTVTPPAGPAGTPRLVLPRSNVKRLRPAAGARLRTLRPVVRWTRGPRGTTLYNVQVFRVGARTSDATAGVRLTKLRSVFPRGRQVRLTGLVPGRCYVWRVWPYVGRRFTSRPLGVSNFCVAATAGRPAPSPRA